MSTGEEFLLYADRALDRMGSIVAELGDELANTRPDLPGANSPFQILTHCLGVIEFWIGGLVAEREIQRDRDAEFTATGEVAGLLERVENTKRQLREDLRRLDPARVVEPAHRSWIPEDREMTHLTVVFHVLEELYQHWGHLDLTRDVLRRSAGA